MSVDRAYNFGMVNRVVSRAQLHEECQAIALELASRPALGNWLTKQALNHVEELRGKRVAADAVFHMHHFAHAQNSLVTKDHLGGLDAKAMASANKEQAGEG
jgi:enoyl-CoA hydratase